MTDRPAYGTAPIRCGRVRCKWRGLETDLKQIPGLLGDLPCTYSACPTCENNSYMDMTRGEIAAWERKKLKGTP